MNRNKNIKNIQILKDILSTLSGDVRRKVIVEAAESKGLIVNDTWPIVKPCAKGATRGHYSVKKMTALADAILNKGKKVKPVVEDIPSIDELVASEKGDPSGEFEAAAARHEEKIYNSGVWGEVPYTEDDVNDELSLMGTYL
tara:strand:+ start:220 stop:645 length:426 start_codon:yes stop_codon:yes gene_type:complete